MVNKVNAYSKLDGPSKNGHHQHHSQQSWMKMDGPLSAIKSFTFVIFYRPFYLIFYRSFSSIRSRGILPLSWQLKFFRKNFQNSEKITKVVNPDKVNESEINLESTSLVDECLNRLSSTELNKIICSGLFRPIRIPYSPKNQ